MGSSSTSPSSCPSVLSAESSVPRYRYDVFLSFRGEDVRKGIIFNLYDELQKTGRIKTFKDDEGLEIGMPISPNLLKAIGESRFVIVVLSPNYASSTWCLDELVYIFSCMEGKDSILPLFYYVDPSDVRNQRGSFGVALSQHEEKSSQDPSQDPEKVKQWRIALGKVGSLSGWDIRNFKSERDLVKHIVGFVCSKVPKVLRPIDSTASVVRQLESNRHVMDESLEEIEEEYFSVGPYGSNKGGESFDDGSYSTVRQLVICYDKYRIFYIQVQYDCDGIPLWSDKHGDFDNDEITTTVTLDYPDEFLTAMNGSHEGLQMLPTQISSLTFKSLVTTLDFVQ